MAPYTLWTAEVKRDLSALSVGIYHSLQAFGYDCAKPVQAKALQMILLGQHMFVSMLTGYGKSLVFQMLPFCTNCILERLKKATVEVPCVLVVSPLIVFMQDKDKMYSYSFLQAAENY